MNAAALTRGGTALPLLIGLFLVLVAAGWVGFVGSDDVTYAHGAYGWIEDFPYVGGHGTIRYPVTVPMALSLLALGGNELGLVAPSLLYALGLLGFSWWWVRRATDAAAAAAAVLLLATTPLLVIISSIANVEAAETLFLFLSVGLCWTCLDEGPSPTRLLLAGAAAGLAFLTRETAVFVVPFYALLFFAGHRFGRAHYLWIAAGFLAVWALELVYLGLMTGDPFYRITVSLNHDSSIDRGVDLAGNLLVHPLIDPLLLLLVNQEFTLLFFLAVPLGAWLCFGSRVTERTRHFTRIVALFGLTWFLCAAAAQTLLPLNPRYFLVTGACAAILAGVGLVELFRAGHTRGALLAGAALLASNAAAIAVENKEIRFGERTLARLIAEQPEGVILTDPMTRYRAALLLRWNGAASRIVDRPARDGDLVFHNPANSTQANARLSAERLASYQPRPDWRPIARFEPPVPLAARLIEATGLQRWLPAGLWRKLRWRHPAATLYRVGGPA